MTWNVTIGTRNDKDSAGKMKNLLRLSNYVLLLMLLICGFSASDASAAKKIPVKIIIFGDSIVAGYGLSNPQKDGLIPKLSTAVTQANQADYVTVVGMGVSGDTTSSALGRLPALITARPDIVMVALGGNDVLRGIDPDITYNNLDIILNELERNGIYTLLAGMKAPPSMGEEFATKFNRLFAKLAEQHRAVFYPFLLESVASLPQFNQRDGIHPNPAGVDIIAGRIGPILANMARTLEKTKSKNAFDQRWQAAKEANKLKRQAR